MEIVLITPWEARKRCTEYLGLYTTAGLFTFVGRGPNLYLTFGPVSVYGAPMVLLVASCIGQQLL